MNDIKHVQKLTLIREGHIWCHFQEVSGIHIVYEVNGDMNSHIWKSYKKTPLQDVRLSYFYT